MTKTTGGALYTETIMQMAFDCDRIEDTNTVKSAKRIIDDVTTVGGDKNESKPKKAKKSRKQMEIEQARANAFAWSQKDLRKIATRRFL